MLEHKTLCASILHPQSPPLDTPLAQYATGTGLFTCWDVKDDFSVTTTCIVTEFVERFQNSWPVRTRDLIPPTGSNP